MPIEYLDEDASYFESQQQTLISSESVNAATISQNQHDGEKTNDWSLFDGLNDTMTDIHDTNEGSLTHEEICKKCLQMELKLQKSQATIAKLQKRCSQKTSEIKRLRVSEKRAKLSKKSLEDLLHDIKENKWISDEGQSVLNVNKPSRLI